MKRLLFVMLLTTSGFVYAEHGCQDGYIPVYQGGQQVCVADYNLPSWGDQDSGPAVPSAPRWADRWGAIATGSGAKLGVVVDMTSERRAKNAALKECKKNGGTDCKLDLSYHNQCAVLVTGDRIYNTAHAATIDEAAALGIAGCEKEDVNCRVYYSACSLAERIR